MADWYHANDKPTKRSEGKSAVGLAAYITGLDLKDERANRWCTRNHPGEVAGWGMIAPDFTPELFTDKKQLSKTVNVIEKSEPRVNSRVAQHWDTALWRHGTEDEHMALAAEMARRISDRYGVWVLYGVHRPTEHGSGDNPHAHFEHNMKELGADGIGGKVRRLVSKQHAANEIIWVRKMMAEVTNDYLASKGSDERVSHLSYRARGIEKEATRHLGNKRNMLEIRGIETNAGSWNRGVRQRNRDAQAEDKQHDQAIAKAEANLGEIRKRKQRMSDVQPSSREYASRQQREIDDRIAVQVSKVLEARDNVEASRRFYERVEHQKNDGEKLRREALERRTPEPDITDANERFMKAAAERFDLRRPEASLGEVVALEGYRAKKEHNELTRLAAAEKDLDKKTEILLRRDIMHADYMAITSERLAGISEFTGGRSRRLELDENGKPIPVQTEAQRHHAQSDHWKEQGDRLRTERQELRERMGDKWMDAAINRKDMEDRARAAGLDPKHMDPGRYRPVDHHLERVKGMAGAERTDHGNQDTAQPAANEKGIRVGDIIDDRREMVRAMQDERRLNNPQHEVTDRVSAQPAREMTDKEQARQTARENFSRVQNDSSRERDQVEGRTYTEAKSKGGRSL